MSHLDIFPLPAFSDNYIWCLRDNQTRNIVVIDPGDAQPIIHEIEQNGLSLQAILITHHHPDHIGGIPDLLGYMETPRVFGPAKEQIPSCNQPLSEPDLVTLPALGIEFEVLNLPGHTLGHIAYYSAANAQLFCGDTLFSAGCGRLFEGTPAQMFASLDKLKALPTHTKIYCTHEYTLSNLAFAAAAEPNNQAITAHQTIVKALREDDQPSLPTRLALELKINPFLRCDMDSVVEGVRMQSNQALTPGLETFTALRAWKDRF